MWQSPYGATSLFFFIFISLTILFFKFDRAIFLCISLEFLVIGIFFYLVFSGESFLAVYFLFCSVVSSVSSLVTLISLVNSTGTDYCYY